MQHEASGDDGRPAGGRQTECTRVSGTLTRRAVCWPASRLAGAATGGVRSRESRAAALLQRRSDTTEDRMGGRTRAARGPDRGGGQQDAEALQDGRRATTAGRLTAASRCGLTARRNGDVPTATFALWLGLARPPICPGALLVGLLSPRLRLSAISGGGGVLDRRV